MSTANNEIQSILYSDVLSPAECVLRDEIADAEEVGDNGLHAEYVRRINAVAATEEVRYALAELLRQTLIRSRR